jgi:myxalamid-type polyketide synthase MxaE and MxaD
LEQPELRTTIVDLPFKPTSDDSSNLVIQLLDERADTEIAVRDGQRYVNRFQIVDPDTDASPGPRKDTLFRADATYLIAGGLGGFGFETAKWLVRRGGRNIALIGRSGPEVHGKEGEIQALQDLGAEVCFLKANIADSAELQFALDTIRCTMPPLRGVINAASDFKQLPGQEALLALATHDLIKKHTSAKIRGTWLLHSKTLEDKLDFFLVFSSVAALMGAVGAAHYVVANVFLDAFVHYRRGLGLPALSINWGAVADAGVLARHQELAQHIDELGNIALPAATLLEEIEHSIFSHQVQIGVGRIDWKSFSRTHSVLARSPRFTEIRSFFRGAAAEEATQLDRIGVLRKLDPHLRRVEVRKGIRRLVAELLETSTSKVGTEAPLRNWGIDSLGCVSLQLAIQDEFGAMLPLVLILEGPPIEQLTTLVLERIS